MRAPIPDDLRRFILTSIPSVPYLEAVLLLHGDAHVLWDAPELAQRLYIPQTRASELLGQLAEAGFTVPAESAKGWCWRPSADVALL